MIGKEAKTILFVLLVVSLLTIGMTDSNTTYAQNVEDIDKYSKNYINRMFTELEPVMMFDEDKHLSLNHTAAQYYGFSPYDIRFGEEYVTVHNNLMETMVAGGNVTEALLPITEGKFSGVFDETKRVKRGYFDSTACGSHNFKNPHTSYRENVTSSLSKVGKIALLKNAGYHQISPILNPGNDFAKISTEARVCDDGPLRDQVTLRSTGYAWQPLEPNPEILLYTAPTYWWNSYTAWWHLVYNQDPNVVHGIAPSHITKPF